MSVRNIKQLPQTRGMLVATAKQVRERVAAVQAESLALAVAETDVRIGTAAVLQSIEDDRTPLDEEIGQLQAILNTIRPAAPVVVVPEPAPEPAPAPVPEPAPAPVPEPAADDLLAQEPAPGPEGPRFNANPRHWSLLQWLLAILGLFIGALVAKMTVEILFWIANNPTAWIKDVLGTIWYVGWIGVGLFSGGLIGFRRQHRR